MLSHKLKINHEDVLFLTFTVAEPETNCQMFPTNVQKPSWITVCQKSVSKEIQGDVPCPDFMDTARSCSGMEGPLVELTTDF